MCVKEPEINGSLNLESDLQTPTSAESFKIKIPRLYVNQRLTKKRHLFIFISSTNIKTFVSTLDTKKKKFHRGYFKIN